MAKSYGAKSYGKRSTDHGIGPGGDKFDGAQPGRRVGGKAGKGAALNRKFWKKASGKK